MILTISAYDHSEKRHHTIRLETIDFVRIPSNGVLKIDGKPLQITGAAFD